MDLYGITKTKAWANQLFYYPGIGAQIENFILSCAVCLKFSRSKIREPILSHKIPEIPFYKIAVDISEFGGKRYLVVVDYYSRWIEIFNLCKK